MGFRWALGRCYHYCACNNSRRKSACDENHDAFLSTVQHCRRSHASKTWQHPPQIQLKGRTCGVWISLGAHFPLVRSIPFQKAGRSCQTVDKISFSRGICPCFPLAALVPYAFGTLRTKYAFPRIPHTRTMQKLSDSSVAELEKAIKHPQEGAQGK